MASLASSSSFGPTARHPGPFSRIAGAVLIPTAGPTAHSSGGAGSLYAPFMDPRGHQRACTGKRPVSRGDAPSAFSGSDEALFTSGVPHHHTPPDLAVSAPLLSHTPAPVGSLVKGDVEGQGDDDDDKGGGSHSSQQSCVKT